MWSLGSVLPLLIVLRIANSQYANVTINVKGTNTTTTKSVAFWSTPRPLTFTTTTTTTTAAGTASPVRSTWDRVNGTKEGRSSGNSPSLLSSLLSWPSFFQSSQVDKKNATLWSLASEGNSSRKTLAGRNADSISEKYSGSSGQQSPSSYHRPHSQFASYKQPDYGNHYYKEQHSHYLYAPPPPPLPPDGALEPVYEPHAKVAVTADFVELKCSVYGDYLPHIRWVKLNGHNHLGHVLFTTIAEGPHVIYDNYHYAVRSDGRSSRLIVREPDPRVHYGTYQCQVMVPGKYGHVAKDDFVIGYY